MPQWKQFSGSWTLSQQMQAKGASTWPAPPGAPTIGTATAGSSSASVAFTAPTDLGVPAVITQYTVTSNPGGITATGSASPINVTGLTNGVAYTFTVTATNATGTGPASAASNSVTPISSGKLYAWGTATDGVLGLNNTIRPSSPVQVGALTDWTTVSVNYSHTLAVRSNGTLWSWGRNDVGQLGQNNTIYRSSPVQIGSLTNWYSVSAGYEYFSFAIKTDGTLWAWGNNNVGQLGTENTINVSSPVQVGGLSSWASVSAGQGFAIATQTDGTLWSWGNNTYGYLGLPSSNVRRSSPTQVGSDTNWSKINAGREHTLAVKTDGTLWAWGSNGYGGLGINVSGTSRSSPVQVGALTDWSLPSSGYWISSAIKTDGTLWTWGLNDSGQLGQNNLIDRSSPVQVGSNTDWAYTDSGALVAGAITTGRLLYMWGAGFSGALGNNNTIYRSSPVQVSTGTNWNLVSISPYTGGSVLATTNE